MFERVIAALHLRDLFSVWALLDILLLALIIYQLLLLIRGTRAAQILIGLTILVSLHLLTSPGLLPLPALHSILGKILLYTPFVIIVVFQSQIRQALARVGRNPIYALVRPKASSQLTDDIALAAASLASKRLGALIVIERELGLRGFYETGILLDAVPTYDLLMNIFTKDSPLHDGAAIIAEGRIKAASCYLPLTTDATLSRTYGTRHRAAIGISEESDALAVVVSEERKVVSLAVNGRIYEDLDARKLAAKLRSFLSNKSDATRSRGAASTSYAVTRESDV